MSGACSIHANNELQSLLASDLRVQLLQGSVHQTRERTGGTGAGWVQEVPRLNAKVEWMRRMEGGEEEKGLKIKEGE